MSQARSHYLACEGREIHVTEWGEPGAPVLVAWHGLARTGRDMDAIAAHLAPRWRVICPDTLGRGLSQWSPLPGQEYCLAFYERLAHRHGGLWRDVSGRRDLRAHLGGDAGGLSARTARRRKCRAARRAGRVIDSDPLCANDSWKEISQ